MSQNDGFQHQDWNEVILTKPVEVKQSGVQKTAEQKNFQKLDGDESVAPRKTSQELKKAIQTARLAKKLSQKQLASSMNTTIQVIAQYENGKAIPNNAFIARLEKQLNVKLPRIKK